MSIRQELKNNAKCYNKHLTDEFLATKSFSDLLCWVHPGDRYEFAKRLYKLGKINEEELQQYKS